MPKDERPKILVVDDDERVLIALEGVLEEAGYDTTTAWGGREALRMIQLRSFDLVLLDEYLPDLASEEILQELRSRSDKTPVALLRSSGGTDYEPAACSGWGTCCLVFKGTPEKIAKCVGEFLSHLHVPAGFP
jgi:CheY-like chemotaxis protein